MSSLEGDLTTAEQAAEATYTGHLPAPAPKPIEFPALKSLNDLRRAAGMPELPKTYWLAYYSDWSEFAVFDSEIECLRYAVESAAMHVAEVPFGVSVRQHLHGQWVARVASNRNESQC